MMLDIIYHYENEAAAEAAYDAAKAAGNQESMAAAIAKHEALEQAAEDKGREFCFMLRLYTEMKERGNALIDLNDVHDFQVAEAVEILLKYGTRRFTFSSTWSSAVSAAWEIGQHGYKLEGMVQINSQFFKIHSDERQKIPAFVFSINE